MDGKCPSYVVFEFRETRIGKPSSNGQPCQTIRPVWAEKMILWYRINRPHYGHRVGLCLSVLTAIFLREPGLAGFILLELRMMEVVMTTGAIRSAKLQSNHHHRQTNVQHFYRPNALPVAQPRVLIACDTDHFNQQSLLVRPCPPPNADSWKCMVHTLCPRKK